MMGILQVKLVTVLVLLKLAAASNEINKTQYYRSLTPQERLEIFNVDDVDHVPDFEIIHIKFPRLQKRSSNEFIPLTLPLANKNVNLNLRLAAPLVGPNTPFYTVYASNGEYYLSTRFPFSKYALNVYEDENQQASLVLDVDADGNKYIQSGFIEAHNISIHRAPSHEKLEMKSCYIIRIIDLILNGNPRPPVRGPVNIPPQSPVEIPDVIYPEILVIVDSLIYRKYSGFDTFKDYILNFWTSVNLKYKTLSRPKYKLSIGGILAAGNRDAFSFFNAHSSGSELNFEKTLDSLAKWLYRYREVIPLDSYDVAIVQTQLSSTSYQWLLSSHEIGLAVMRSACSSNSDTGATRVGIIYDDNNYQGIHTATHELGHILGAYHDDESGCRSGKSIMSAYSPTGSQMEKLGWSQCSINGFHNFLRTNPKCLFNVPESYQNMIQTTTMAPSPKVNIDIDNDIGIEPLKITKNESHDDSHISKNNREVINLLPKSQSDLAKLNVPNTLVPYVKLNSSNINGHYKLKDDWMLIQVNTQRILPGNFLHIAIVNKTEIYIFQLEGLQLKKKYPLPARPLHYSCDTFHKYYPDMDQHICW